ncbi:MAG: hypothetical protein ABIS01_04255, partial [Ferruginibacter sp.]
VETIFNKMKSNLLTAIMCLTLSGCKTYGQTNASNLPTEIKKQSKMKEFSLLVRVPLTYTAEQAKAVNPKWDSILSQWIADSVYIISFPFPGEGYVVSGSEKSIKKGAVTSDNLRVVSNLFIRAVNIESAIELAKACPILEFGGSVEVREIPQRPVKAKNKN